MNFIGLPMDIDLLDKLATNIQPDYYTGTAALFEQPTSQEEIEEDIKDRLDEEENPDDLRMK